MDTLILLAEKCPLFYALAIAIIIGLIFGKEGNDNER